MKSDPGYNNFITHRTISTVGFWSGLIAFIAITFFVVSGVTGSRLPHLSFGRDFYWSSLSAFDVLWRLDTGDCSYAKFNITEVEYDNPGIFQGTHVPPQPLNIKT